MQIRNTQNAKKTKETVAVTVPYVRFSVVAAHLHFVGLVVKVFLLSDHTWPDLVIRIVGAVIIAAF